MFLLIHPPVAKPCEPPAGISLLGGALKANGIEFRLLDANLHCLITRLGEEPNLRDTWNKRAWRSKDRHLSSLSNLKTYENISRYTRAVKDLTRLLSETSKPHGCKVTMSDYSDEKLSPLRSEDLLAAAEKPEKNLFFSSFRQLLEDSVEQNAPSVAGFSLNYLGQVLPCFSMIGFLSKNYPKLPIVLGGGLVGSWMSRPTWQNPFRGLVDEMVAGAGESRLLQMVKENPLEGPHMPYYDWARGLGYLSPGFVLPYSAARGCYWRRCSFCPEKAEANPYIPIPSRTVLSQLKILRNSLRPSLIHLLDNALSPSLLEALSKEPPGAPWYGFAKISEHLADYDFVRSLKESGCLMLKLGLESGDQAVLDRLEKGITLDTASRVLRCLKRVGVAAYVYLLFGTPAEGEEEAFRTLDFIGRHAEQIRFLNIAIFNMPAWGNEASIYQMRDFYEGDLALYKDFVHPLGWDRARVRAFIEKVFKRNRAVAGIIRRDPIVFTSNHAPFFVMAEKDVAPF